MKIYIRFPFALFVMFIWWVPSGYLLDHVRQGLFTDKEWLSHCQWSFHKGYSVKCWLIGENKIMNLLEYWIILFQMHSLCYHQLATAILQFYKWILLKFIFVERRAHILCINTMVIDELLTQGPSLIKMEYSAFSNKRYKMALKTAIFREGFHCDMQICL